ncbi:unnamed protein product, partial [Gongylonema pulchrum]|uniref:Activin_recp domain-containing protein n=1 Tax=Gongylonema pulchrum TaxID=637853 RepID=A0A183D3H2_9BILA
TTVKCFCDKQNCEDSLICTGELCLIGFRNEGTQAHLEQLCSSTGDIRDLSKCQQNWNGWQEVCVCEENFCNTFAYLRGSIEEENGHATEVLKSPAFHEDGSTLDQTRRRSGSNLIVLLVIIPLSIGALAVCLIFINYHCKMC